MATVCLVSLYDRNAYGLRVMTASLKEHGHRAPIIFVKRYDTNPTYRMDLEVGEYPWMGINKSGRIFKYASNSQISTTELELLRQTVEKIRPDVIGLTVNTPLRIQAVKVTQFLRKHFQIPIIWGGYDPTVNAADCLPFCDYACAGEGDQTILDVAERVDQGRSLDDVGNLAYTRNGKITMNPKHPVEQNLDRYPWRDDLPEDKFLIEDNRIIANYAGINDLRKGVYQAMSARGCPYKCSYCCEATFKDLYRGEKFLRRRSPQNMVAELAEAKRQFGLTRIHFDDEIFAMNLKWLEEFAPLYKRDIDLPFYAYIYPTRNIESILKLLKGVGLTYCCLALESGSERINKEVFDRVYDRSLFLHTAQVCKDLAIPFYTDVITYIPQEEEEDLKKTLDVLVEIGGGFDMCINKLFVLPGTKMAEQMKLEGRVVGDSAKDPLFNYYCRMFWITSFSHHSRRVIDLIEKAGIFRRYPQLLNPIMVEAVVNPISWATTVLKKWLPKPVLYALHNWKEKQRAKLNVSDAIPNVACR